jgi:carbonic anhydrase
VSQIDDLAAANLSYAEHHPSNLAAAPSRRVAVVTCMDARIDVYAGLGLSPGEAHVIRNAGGIVTDDVLRSLAISQRKLGTRDVMVVHHSRCGMLGVDDDAFAAELAEATGEPPAWRAGGFADLEDDVRASVRRIAAAPYLPGPGADGEVRGFVFDVDTGRLREVDPAG